MDITDAPNLPPVPKLKGEQNFLKWNNLIIKTAEHYRLADELFALQARTSKRKGLQKFIVSKVSDAIMTRLRNLGLAMDDTENNIYHDIIGLIFPLPIGIMAGDLLAEFSIVEWKCYLSLHDFQARVQVLRYQLLKSGCDVGDTPACWFVLNGLKKSSPGWHRSLVRQMHAKKLTWPWLMVELASEAFYETQLANELGQLGNGENDDNNSSGVKDEVAGDGSGEQAAESAGNRSHVGVKRPRLQ